MSENKSCCRQALQLYTQTLSQNGLLRTYYNDYTGTNVFGGYSTSFNTVKGIIEGANT